ncbi:MAG: hypothetical protein ACYC3N_10615 [Halothiobacillus sp.]
MIQLKTKVCLFLMLYSVLWILPSHAEEASKTAGQEALSLTSPHACKKPPKAPPSKLLHQTYDSEGAPTNYPFITNEDINGDGWCDWVGTGAFDYPLRSQYDPVESDKVYPPLKDFIFLGTKDGWRRWGNMQAIRKSYDGIDPDSLASDILLPMAYAAFFISPTFVYEAGNTKPFVITSGGPGMAYEGLEWFGGVTMENIEVYRWDEHLDLLQKVEPQEKDRVIAFILQTACDAKKDYSDDAVMPHHSTIGVICYGASESCPEGRKKCGGSTSQ